MGLQTSVKASNTAFFKNLSACSEKQTNKAVKERTIRMRDILRYRRSMYSEGGANARYPRWYENKRPHSYAGWMWKETKPNQFYLINTVTRDGYPYPKALVHGLPSNTTNPFWKWAPSKNLVKNNGRIFSRQMPLGIQPWIDKQREYMKEDIKIAIKECND